MQSDDGLPSTIPEGERADEFNRDLVAFLEA
jgi:hypothetical protein